MKNLLLLCLLLGGYMLPNLAFGDETTATDLPALKIVRSDPGMPNLVSPDDTRGYGEGFVRTPDDVFICDNGELVNTEKGVTLAVPVNQQKPELLLAGLESRATSARGALTDYSLYLDLDYQDGTHEYGLTAPFSQGTHDWEYKQVIFLPPKPVKTIFMHALFRSTSGKAEFRNFLLQSMPIKHDTFPFDMIPVTKAGSPLPEESLLVRDTGNNSDFLYVGDAHQTNSSGDLFDVSFQWQVTQDRGMPCWHVELTSKTEEDRILSFYYLLDIPAGTVNWFDHPRHTEQTEPNREYRNATSLPVGANGHLSRYPFGAVGSGQKGTAIGLNPFMPAFFRIGYNESFHKLYLAFDVALTKEKPTAAFDFFQFSFDVQNEFRGALDRYRQIWPEAFVRRITQQGLWMPFAAISEVENPDDFGFRFKEGTDETQWDDEHNILTFRYTEPLTWWMSMDKEVPRTKEAAFEQVLNRAKAGDRQAQAFLTSGMHDREGNLAVRLMDTPWCDGAFWNVCELPGLTALVRQGRIEHAKDFPISAYELKWNDDICNNLYPEGTEQGPGCDGEYLDSMGIFVVDRLNYRREHFSASQMPLVYDRDTRKPGMLSALTEFEYLRDMATEVHRRGRFMMANSTPSTYFWFAPYLDVMGTETNWNRDNTWQPMTDEDLLYRRALCGEKPYCFLMNTDFLNFSASHTERYMKRCLAYGMFPGFFSADASTGHYFRRPELYNRDRPLFKKYIPLCKLVAEAGWQPLTYATTSDSLVYVERFGSTPEESIFTVYNDSQNEKNITVRFDSDLLARSALIESVRELVSGQSLALKDGTVQLTLAPGDVAVLAK
ncbi:MAG: hypothetical protein Q4G68_03210 [Planctomycetia bacterium]|nr:hypothetical protein [Planctomycetia bacterium]